MNLDKSYKSLFELLWYSQLPCFDIINVTSTKEEYGIKIGRLEYWKIKFTDLTYNIDRGSSFTKNFSKP